MHRYCLIEFPRKFYNEGVRLVTALEYVVNIIVEEFQDPMLV